MVHGKQREIRTELVAILQREALLQHAKLSKANTDLVQEKEKFEKKLQAADSNSQVKTLQHILKEQIELADQLKTALESKQRENKALEKNSLEANSDLEESIKLYEETITWLKKQYQTLQGENTYLQQELNSTRQLNSQINETKNETQKNLNTISVQRRTQATRIKDLEIIQHDPEQTVNYLKLNIEDFNEREKLYREAEELYEQNFQDIADQTYDTTRFLEELRNSSICKELNSKGTLTTLELQ